jgi:hypothetical protein
MQMFKNLSTFLLATFLLATSAGLSIASGQDDDPFAKSASEGGDSNWGNGDANDSDWQGGQATIDDRAIITSGGIDCPVILGGSTVVSTDKLKLIGKLDCKFRSSTLTALSNDGTFFAVASKTTNQKDTSVAVYDLKTGKKTCDIPGSEDEILDVLLLTRGKYVVTAGRSSPIIRVWNGETGKSVKEFEMPERSRLDQGKVAFTSDGKYMAVIRQKELVVLQVSSGKVVATMEPPTHVDQNGDPTSRSSSNDHVFIYSSIQDLEFPPSGTELAAVSTSRGHRMLCWNKNAKLVVNQPFSLVQRNSSWENDIQWMPDGKSWLVGGNLVERITGRVLLAFEKKFASDVQLLVHDQNTILGRLGSAPNIISKVEVPWDKISRAQQAIADKEPALIAPYQAVDIRLEFGDTLGALGDARKSIIDAVKSRLNRDGIEYEVGAANYFKLRFSEALGDTLPIFERQSVFGGRGRDTGKTMTETKGSLVVEFFAAGAAQPAWREVLDAKSSRRFRQEINAQSVRESMLDRLSRELEQMQFPYFMPTDEKLPALPMIIK